MALTTSLNPNSVTGKQVAFEVVNLPPRQIEYDAVTIILPGNRHITQVHEWYALTDQCATTAAQTVDTPPSLTGYTCTTTFDVYEDQRYVGSSILRRTRYYIPDSEVVS